MKAAAASDVCFGAVRLRWDVDRGTCAGEVCFGMVSASWQGAAGGRWACIGDVVAEDTWGTGCGFVREVGVVGRREGGRVIIR